ncbi:MAG: hypothetical protein AAF997_18685 [Myxococcota bacterium]
MHEHFKRGVGRFGDERAGAVEHLHVVPVLITEAVCPTRDERVQPFGILMEGRGLAFGEMLVLALVHEKRDCGRRNGFEELLDSVDEGGQAARHHHAVVVEYEEARLRQQVGIAGVVMDQRNDVCFRGADDVAPHGLSERAQRRMVGRDDQLQFLFRSLEKARCRHGGRHDAHFRPVRKCDPPVLAPPRGGGYTP